MVAVRIPFSELLTKAPGWCEVMERGPVVTYVAGGRIPGRLEVCFDKPGKAVANDAAPYISAGTTRSKIYRPGDLAGDAVLSPGQSYRHAGPFSRLYVRLLPGDGPAVDQTSNVNGPFSVYDVREDAQAAYVWSKAFADVRLDPKASVMLMVGNHAMSDGQSMARPRAVRIPALVDSNSPTTLFAWFGGTTGNTVKLVQPGRVLTAYELSQHRRISLQWGVRNFGGGTQARSSNQQACTLTVGNMLHMGNAAPAPLAWSMGGSTTGLEASARINAGPAMAWGAAPPWTDYNSFAADYAGTFTIVAGTGTLYALTAEWVLDDGDPDLNEVEQAFLDSNGAPGSLAVGEYAAWMLPCGTKLRRARMMYPYLTSGGGYLDQMHAVSLTALAGASTSFVRTPVGITAVMYPMTLEGSGERTIVAGVQTNGGGAGVWAGRPTMALVP